MSDSKTALSAATTELEHVLDDKEILGRFYEFLSSIYSTESFDFWLEAEMYRHQDESTLPVRAEDIYTKYFGDNPESPLNVDDPTIEDEVRKRMEKPGKDTFLRAQSLVWGLLKFECFARFKTSPQWSTPLNKKQKSDLKKSRIGTLINDWVAYYKKARKKGLDLHIGEGAEPTPAKAPLVDRLYDLPDIEEIFEDESMFLAFREYLYRQFANENLTFWIETELYRHLPTESERKARGKEIWDKFCTPESPMPVNIDFNARKAIQNALASSGPNIYRDAERVTWKVLKNEWFPEFCASDVFHELNDNDDGVEYKRSTTTRERGNTVDMYHNLVAVRAQVDASGRDFIKEINEEPEHWSKKDSSVPKIKAPPISPKFSKENPWESPRSDDDTPKSAKRKDKDKKDSPKATDEADNGETNGESKSARRHKDKERERRPSESRHDKDKSHDKDKDKERRHKDKSHDREHDKDKSHDKEHHKDKSHDKDKEHHKDKSHEREHKDKDKSRDKHK